ncbi:MAG TPA: anion transporter [Geminicoccaceae bacterium]|nr:anion transporter [Geminicoccaceae bacterium]
MTPLVLVVFAAVYLGMALGRWPGLMLDRTGIALVGAIVLVLVGAVTGEEVRAAVDVPTLVVLFGLMVLSAQFGACGFYAWCSRRIALTPAGPQHLLALTVATAGLLSAVLANDVVVFAMTPMLASGLSRRGLDPRPFLIALTSAANAGSAATVIGNPQNILIGQSGGLDFFAFLAVCGPPALVGLLVTYAVVLLAWRGRFELRDPRVQHGPPGAAPALDGPGLVKALVATGALLLLFATPLPRTEGVLLVAGGLLISRKLSTRRILGLVDWHLLVLFGALFVVTHAFDATGLPERLVATLAESGMPITSPWLLGPLTVVGSNTIGNVPLVVLLLQILPSPGPDLLYFLAVVSTLAGNLLIVGSLANIITVERAKEVGVGLGFLEHAECGVPIAVLSLTAAVVWLAFAAPSGGQLPAPELPDPRPAALGAQPLVRAGHNPPGEQLVDPRCHRPGRLLLAEPRLGRDRAVNGDEEIRALEPLYPHRYQG